MRDRFGLGRIWAVVLLAVVVYAVVVPMVAQVDQADVDFAMADLPPSSAHLFGTDSAGHDLLVRTAQALRVSLLVATATGALSAVVGTLVGVTAAYRGGAVDRVLMRFADGLDALPHLILGLLVVSMFRGSATVIVLALVATHWITVARTTRAAVLGLRHSDVVSAAHLAGRGRAWVVARHLVPAAAGQALVATTLLIPHAVWHEATLSFLGVGLPAHRASLGTLLADAKGSMLLGGWWVLAAPAGLLVLFTLAFRGVGSALERRIGRMDGSAT